MRMNRILVKSTLVGALGGLLFGFDTAVIAGSTRSLTHTFSLTPFWLGVTVSVALWGTAIGALSSGELGERLGGRGALRVMAALYLISSLGCAFAWNWDALLVFRFIGGLGIGGSSVLGPVYIAEMSPAKWRGRMVGLFQVMVVTGILIAYFSNFCVAQFHLGNAEWHWQLGIPALPALLFLILLYGIPRSSRWLVTQNRVEEAREVLAMIGTPDTEAELNEIVRSVHRDRSQKREAILQRKYLFPIFLAVATGMFNQLAGINAILYYLNSIFASAGFNQMSSSGQGRHHRLHQLGRDTLRHVDHRQGGAQKTSARRRSGNDLLSRRRGMALSVRGAIGMAAVAPGWLHHFLCDLAGRGRLGLYQRDLPQQGACQRAEFGRFGKLDHECADCLVLPARRGALACHALLWLRRHDGSAVCSGSLAVA